MIVVDRDLPAVHGDGVCRQLVARRCESRILLLTAAARSPTGFRLPAGAWCASGLR